MCGCYYCKNRRTDQCGRHPDFLCKRDCEEQGIEWVEELFVDCDLCNNECPTLLCQYFEEGNDNE